MTTAVVFAYHNVGVRCLSVLLDQGVQVILVVTHRTAYENIWFDSVVPRAPALPVIAPEDPNDPAVVAQIRRCDFVLVYYQSMLASELLAGAARRLQHARLAAAEVPRARTGNWA